MKVIKGSNTTFVTREDGVQLTVFKVKNSYEVWCGRFTGYKFRSLKKALEYCEFGF